MKLVILGHFFALLPPKNLKNQNSEKMNKNAGDTIILHTCTKNHNHMMYGSWNTESNRQNFMSFWAIFCPLMILKITILKTWKKSGKILSFYTYMCTINEDHMIYGSWNIRHDRHNFLSFWVTFCPSPPPPWQPEKSKFWKIEKNKKKTEILSV